MSMTAGLQHFRLRAALDAATICEEVRADRPNYCS